MPDVHEDHTEMELVEKPTIQLFEELGWETVNAENETLGPGSIFGCVQMNEIVLTDLFLPIDSKNSGFFHK